MNGWTAAAPPLLRSAPPRRSDERNAVVNVGCQPDQRPLGSGRAALLLQFSTGGVYAWSVFSKALQAAEPFQLSKVEATLPFQVTIGMIFVGT